MGNAASCVVLLLFAEMFVQKILNARKEMHAGIAAVYAMIAVCIELRLELYAMLHIDLGQFRHILEMNIVVGKSMNEQEFTMEFISTCQRIVVIAFCIRLRKSHIAFRVCAVVIPV